jgi:hypothetical protein
MRRKVSRSHRAGGQHTAPACGMCGGPVSVDGDGRCVLGHPVAKPGPVVPAEEAGPASQFVPPSAPAAPAASPPPLPEPVGALTAPAGGFTVAAPAGGFTVAAPAGGFTAPAPAPIPPAPTPPAPIPAPARPSSAPGPGASVRYDDVMAALEAAVQPAVAYQPPQPPGFLEPPVAEAPAAHRPSGAIDELLHWQQPTGVSSALDVDAATLPQPQPQPAPPAASWSQTVPDLAELDAEDRIQQRNARLRALAILGALATATGLTVSSLL